MGTGQCGASFEEYAQLHALPDLDLCEYHDYDADDEPMPGDEWNGLHRRLSQCVGLGKPLFVGEAGIPAEVGLHRRADLFDAKIERQFAAGVAGYLVWTWRNLGNSGDEFAVGPRDPLMAVLGRYAMEGANPPLGAPAGPPMGFNHYNAFGNAVDEAKIREVADAMVRNGMRDAGYSYVNLDDSWQGPRDASGNITANENYPSGIKALGDYVHARGLKLSIYTTPAAKSCGGRPGSAGNAERDVRTFAAWGVDYIKLDWCGADYSPDGARQIAERWRAAIAASGRPMILSINAGGDLSVPTWASRTTTMWRTGDDICASWFNKTREPSAAAQDCWTRRYHSGIFDYIESSTERHEPYVGPGRWADPDMLEVGNSGLTDDEARSHFGLWAMWSAPLLAGNDPRRMTGDDATSAILLNSEVIAIDQDPMSTMARTVQASSSERVWIKPMSRGRFAVLALNLSNQPRDITLTWNDIGIHGRFTLRDVWAHLDGGPISSQFHAAQVPPHGSVMLVLSPTV
jgi:alpha-galactosidase